ncbi:hypothetical protein FRB94_007171 [Tulasnella sp. JGI-2019a]|nr:hypothetical protein FRB94_007171 [Tulasnella sp. JGI-2019a]KAG9006526.1 hypothetical protein FRB93_008654 [Tulasnella sp. JGI-2019a]KAG9022862.1 hypothetical protein FRB95_014064 [Tulasnella sp. JGI-2019a]
MAFNSFYRFWTQCFPPTSTFDVNTDIPDLSGKVTIVTGGNSGIGKETVKVLLSKNAKVYMASRSRERAEAAIQELKKITGREAIFLELDLANLDAVTRSAQEFKGKEYALHILFNSGGVMNPPVDLVTHDGYDLQFGTNVLGHAHFTLCLIPELEAGAKSSPDGKARIVNTSSITTYFNTAPWIRWGTLRDGPERRAMRTRALYCQSKFGNVAFSNEFARRYADHGITSNAVNPGNLKTELGRYASPLQKWFSATFVQYPAPLGAVTQLMVGTSHQTANVNGGWFIPWARPYNHERETHNPELEAKLWDWIEEQRKGH